MWKQVDFTPNTKQKSLLRHHVQKEQILSVYFGRFPIREIRADRDDARTLVQLTRQMRLQADEFA
jgi:hypothetical protein